MTGDPTQLETHRKILAYEEGWWDDFQAQVRAGRPWVLSTLVAPREIFDAMGVLVLEDLTLVRPPKPREHYAGLLKDQGYLASLQGLGHRMALALALDEADTSTWCGLPKPAMVCTTASDRAAHVMAAHYGVPCLEMETPALRRLSPTWWENCRWDWEDLDEPDRIDLMQAQYDELIAYLERYAGATYDAAALAATVDRVNRQEEYFDEVRTLAAEAPKMPFRMSEVEQIVLAVQHNRGGDWSLDHARMLRDEVKTRVEAGFAIAPNERLRMMWNGTQIKHDLPFWRELETTHGLVFVRSLFLSIASDGYLRYGAKNPVRAMASRYATMNNQGHIPPLSSAWAIHEAKRHRVNGALHQMTWEWYNFMPADLNAAGVPTLAIAAPPEAWNRDEMRARILQFIETEVTDAARKAGVAV